MATTKEQREQGKAELLEEVKAVGPQAYSAITSMIDATERATGQPMSELGVMVLVAQVTMTEALTRLTKGERLPNHVLESLIRSIAETLSSYMEAADKAVTEWESTDPSWS